MGFLKKLFKKSVFASVYLNARIMPLTRGDLFEDPLNEFLEIEELGEVTGGGTELAEGGVLVSCNLDLELNRTDPDAIQGIIETLNELGAPKGSYLEISGEKHPLGNHECALVSCDSQELSDELVGRVQRTREPEDMPHQYGEYSGQEGRQIYLYGPSFEAIRDAFDQASQEEPKISVQIEQVL